jgi:hypothetical protein
VATGKRRRPLLDGRAPCSVHSACSCLRQLPAGGSEISGNCASIFEKLTHGFLPRHSHASPSFPCYLGLLSSLSVTLLSNAPASPTQPEVSSEIEANPNSQETHRQEEAHPVTPLPSHCPFFGPRPGYSRNAQQTEIYVVYCNTSNMASIPTNTNTTTNTTTNTNTNRNHKHTGPEYM